MPTINLIITTLRYFQQRGSVMCSRTSSSEPAHPHFWHKYLQNKNREKTPEIQVLFKKNVCEKRSPQTPITEWSEKAALQWWDQPLLRKQVKTNNKIKQQKQQTLITPKTSCPLKKAQNLTKVMRRIKLKKLKIASDKTETNKITCTLLEKIYDRSLKRLGNN